MNICLILLIHCNAFIIYCKHWKRLIEMLIKICIRIYFFHCCSISLCYSFFALYIFFYFDCNVTQTIWICRRVVIIIIDITVVNDRAFWFDLNSKKKTNLHPWPFPSCIKQCHMRWLSARFTLLQKDQSFFFKNTNYSWISQYPSVPLDTKKIIKINMKMDWQVFVLNWLIVESILICE